MSLLSKAVAALFVSASLHAQPLIGGRVVDRASRVPLGQVAVELIATISEAVLDTAVTANDGVFMLVAPRPGTYRVRLTATGAGRQVSDSLVVGVDEYLAREFPIDRSRREFSVIEVDMPVQPVWDAMPRMRLCQRKFAAGRSTSASSSRSRSPVSVMTTSTA